MIATLKPNSSQKWVSSKFRTSWVSLFCQIISFISKVHFAKIIIFGKKEKFFLCTWKKINLVQINQWGRNEIILREDLFNKIFWNYKFSAKFISKIQKFMGVTGLRLSLVPPSLFIFTILVQMQNSRTFFNVIDQVLNAGLKFKSCCLIHLAV